jgi:hypothetical protein
MTTNTTDEAYPTWLLALLFAVALLLVLVALYLWIWRPPDDSVVIGPTATPTAARNSSSSPTPTLLADQSPTSEPVPSFTVAATLAATASPEATAPVAATTSPGATASPEVMASAEATASATATSPPEPASPTTQPGATTTTTAPQLTATISQPVSTATPVVTENTGTLAGRIALQGRSDASNVNLRVDGTQVPATQASGEFSITLPPGRYTIEASYPGYVTAQAMDVEVRTGETTTLPPVTLLAGDTDRDGDVDLYDVVRWVINFKRAGREADSLVDLNEDGVIDIRDLILIQRNYRARMPAPWRQS